MELTEEIKRNFIDQIAPIAIEVCNEWGLYPSICISQACVESRFGTSELAINANNIFGKKWNKGSFEPYFRVTNEYLSCSLEEALAKGWTPVNIDTGLYSKTLPFNIYESWRDSLNHYCANIMTARWYAVPRSYIGDYYAFLQALAVVYAPGHPTYADDILIRVEKYGLREFDT